MTVVEQLLAWLRDNPQWGAMLVMTIAFFESLVVVGLMVPGWVFLVGVGVLIGKGDLPFFFIAVASYIGAVSGESVSYYLGWHYKSKIQHWRWFQKHPKWLSRSQLFFDKHGAASVAFGRFFGPIRAFVPFVAGASNMSPLRFSLVNLLSALVWAPAYLMPGVIVGAAIDIPQQQMLSLVLAMVALTIFMWLFIGNFLKIYKKNTWPLMAGIEIKVNIVLYIKCFLNLMSSLVLIYFLLFGSLSSIFLELCSSVWEIVIS